jgi:hypothetical protein
MLPDTENKTQLPTDILFFPVDLTLPIQRQSRELSLTALYTLQLRLFVFQRQLQQR